MAAIEKALRPSPAGPTKKALQWPESDEWLWTDMTVAEIRLRRQVLKAQAAYLMAKYEHKDKKAA